jgi:tetratricopeptide (TPR) repeat protein
MKLVLAILLCGLPSTFYAQTKCVESAREVSPRLTAEAKQNLETKYAHAKKEFEAHPNDVERLIWFGRRTAYLGHYKDAITIYTRGIEQFPSDARLYRHRGHRLITIRCFDAAIDDFEKAAKLVKGKPDEIEPDGLPNARNIPTSTLQSNIWYHLGLAHYLKGNFRKALSAYREAEKASKNADMLVATSHWLYMTQRRLGRHEEAAKTLALVDHNLDVIENADYYRLIKLYQGKQNSTDFLHDTEKGASSLSNATVGYGLGNWFFYNGKRADAEKIFRQVTAGDQWASFGYIAAEAELKRRK